MRNNNVNTINGGGIDNMMKKRNAVKSGLMASFTVVAIGAGLEAGSWVFGKIKDGITDFIESQKLPLEEVEKMKTVIEIRRGKNYKSDEDDQFDDDFFEEEEETVAKTSTNPVVTGEDVATVAEEILKEVKEEEKEEEA